MAETDSAVHSPTATPPSTPALPPSLIQITIPVNTKLDRTNFLAWKSQVEPIIHAYGLFHHLDDLHSAPSPKIDATQLPNPAYLPWQQQDQFLLGWLRSSITGTVLAQYVTCLTAKDLWRALHRVYSVVSKAKLMDLRRSLQLTPRGGSSCHDYFEKMRGFADQLAAIGSPVSDSDLVNHILMGLGPDYNSFVVSLTTRQDSISLDDLHGFLLAHENLLTSQSAAASDPMALYARPQPSGPSQPTSSRDRGNKGRGGYYKGGPNRPPAGRGTSGA